MANDLKMSLKKIYLFLKQIPFVYVFALSALFILIVVTTIRTHKVESYYELAHLKSREESKLSQLTSDELNEIRLSIISRIGDFSKVLNKFKLNKLNATINVDQVPSGVLSIGKSIRKWPVSSNDSLKILLNDLKVAYLDRIILEDTVIDKQSSVINILMRLKKIQFKGKFSICMKNGTFSCLNGDFEQLANETIVSWSAKLILHDQLKFSFENANLINHIDFSKVQTRAHLNVKPLGHLVDQVLSEFVKVHLNKEFSKLVNYEIGQTISSIYADLFDSKSVVSKIPKNKTANFIKNEDALDEEDFDDLQATQSKNQTTLQLLRNLINLPSMISNVMYKLIDTNLNARNTPKITFHNQDIETILKTNLSTLQALKTKYLSTLKEHVENLNLDSKTRQQQNLPAIAQPFFELIESQLRDTLETKIDGLINSMSTLNSQISKLKTNENEDQSESENEKQANSELVADIDQEIEQSEHGVDTDDLLPENDEIIDEYTQTLRSQRTKRQVPCNRGQELDEYVDSLFRFASRLIRAMEPVSIPNATIDLPEYNMKLFIHHCGATRAHTLQRKRPAWVYCTNESVSLGLTVGFEDVRVKCKYRAIKDWQLMWDGELEAKMEHTKLQVQFTQTTPEEDSDVPVMQRIDRIRIWRLGHVKVLIKGLGNFTQAVSMLLTRMINQNMDQLAPTLRHLEGEVIGIGNNMLRNISIPFFSII